MNNFSSETLPNDGGRVGVTINPPPKKKLGHFRAQKLILGYCQQTNRKISEDMFHFKYLVLGLYKTGKVNFKFLFGNIIFFSSFVFYINCVILKHQSELTSPLSPLPSPRPPLPPAAYMRIITNSATNR